MIFEVMPSGDLQNLLRKTKKRADQMNKPIDEMINIDEFLRFAIDIASGMDHLSSHNVGISVICCFNVSHFSEMH